jgi:hypothetical protein
MSTREPTTELANRMAGRFFVVFGVGVLFFAAALRSTLAVDTPVFVWILAAFGIVAIAFGIFAPRKLRASVLEAFVTFIWI